MFIVNFPGRRRIRKMGYPGGGVAATAAAPWYLSGGIDASACVAAYKAIGAASAAASYVNLANPGTYDLTTTAAPAFAAETGWTFNGTTQFLRCGITTGADASWSYIMRYSDLTTTGTRWLFGGGTFDNLLIIQQSGGEQFTLFHGAGVGGGAINDPVLTGGVYGICGKVGYRNGVADATAIGAGALGAQTPIALGAGYYFGTLANFSAIKIQAFVIYNITLTTENVAVKAAMAALA